MNADMSAATPHAGVVGKIKRTGKWFVNAVLVIAAFMLVEQWASDFVNFQCDLVGSSGRSEEKITYGSPMLLKVVLRLNGASEVRSYLADGHYVMEFMKDGAQFRQTIDAATGDYRSTRTQNGEPQLLQQGKCVKKV